MANTELFNPRDAKVFVEYLDDIARRYAAACERARSAVDEVIDAEGVPKDVTRIGEELTGMLEQVRHDAERQFAQLRTACTDAIAAGNAW